ncbi:MAG: RteC domain-containing protein [Bacteroidota bacterium]
MPRVFTNILKKLDNELEALESETEDVIQKAEKGIKITRQSLEALRAQVNGKQFKDNATEIHFFKNIKPQIFSKLIYYVTLFNIETKRPRSSRKTQVKYLNKHIDKLQIYFHDNLEFYHYYRRGATYLDGQYFLRGKGDIRLHPDTFHFFTDKQFSTSHDCTVATILAYDMLIVHLKKETNKLENTNGMETEAPSFQYQSKLFWTNSKTDLIELIYALDSSGAINNGTADIKEVATVCEHIFNIDLGNFYHTYIEIKSRKSNNTKFLDKLKEALVNRMEDSDA